MDCQYLVTRRPLMHRRSSGTFMVVAVVAANAEEALEIAPPIFRVPSTEMEDATARLSDPAHPIFL